jgi:hypothetical protein
MMRHPAKNGAVVDIFRLFPDPVPISANLDNWVTSRL